MSEKKHICDSPGCTNPAVVHLTQVDSEKLSAQHFCQECAEEKGIETGKQTPNFTLTDFLAQLGESSTEQAPAKNGEPCSFCGLRFAKFKEGGRLGCPHCYSTFDRHLRGLLRRVHGATQHVGKVYLPPSEEPSDARNRLAALRRRLERSVESEDFERAAVIRDQIRSLEIEAADHG